MKSSTTGLQSNRDRLFAPSILRCGAFGALFKGRKGAELQQTPSAERWEMVSDFPRETDADLSAIVALTKAFSELDAHELIARSKLAAQRTTAA